MAQTVSLRVRIMGSTAPLQEFPMIDPARIRPSRDPDLVVGVALAFALPAALLIGWLT